MRSRVQFARIAHASGAPMSESHIPVDTASPSVRPRLKPGPKPTGHGVPVVARLSPEPLAALDAYIAAQPGPRLTRPEAVRRLIAKALRA